MIELPITAIPNQAFSAQLAGNNYQLRIHDCGSVMSVDVTINNVLIVSGVRAVPGFPIIPSRYLENGNFAFITENDEYPDWLKFGIDQYLVFADEDELIAIRANASS